MKGCTHCPQDVQFSDQIQSLLNRLGNHILLELVAKTLAVGAYQMQVEYEDRKEHVLAFHQGFGFGIASLDARSEEAQALREALYQLRRKQKIFVRLQPGEAARP
jgi:hypothetical protein